MDHVRIIDLNIFRYCFQRQICYNWQMWGMHVVISYKLSCIQQTVLESEPLLIFMVVLNCWVMLKHILSNIFRKCLSKLLLLLLHFLLLFFFFTFSFCIPSFLSSLSTPPPPFSSCCFLANSVEKLASSILMFMFKNVLNFVLTLWLLKTNSHSLHTLF